MSSITFPGLDVIDVCSLSSASAEPAVCAVGRDCTLLFFRDVWNDRQPSTLKFKDISGTAYRVMSSRGHLFLLTSSGLFIFAGLARRFLEGESIDSTPTPGRIIPLEAVDANLAGDHWLLIVMPDGVVKADVDLLVGNVRATPPNGDEQEYNPTLIQPTWTAREMASTLIAAS